MKNKFILRLLSLVTIMVLLYSCRNEFSPEQEAYNNSDQFRPTSRTIRLEESKHKLVLKTELQKAQDNLTEIKINTSGKSVDYANGVSIDTDNVTYIEAGPNFHTYTFNLVRENTPENAPLENLVLSSLPDGTYKELLVTYNFSSEEKKDLLAGKFVKTAGKGTAIELAKGTYGGVISNRSMGGAESCSYQTVDMVFSCYTGEHHSGNESSWDGCNWQNADGGYPPLHITTVALVCTASTALGDDGAPGGGTGSGDGGGLGGGNNTETPTIPTLGRFFFYVKKLPVDLKAIINDTANTEFYDGFKTYYDVNYGSVEAEEFITWALQFKQNNPTISWRQFENWFLTKSEGADGEPIDNLDDVLNTISYQNKQMPTYSQFVGAFPKLDYPGYPGYFKQMPASQIYPMVGGNLEYLYNSSGQDTGPYRNACTVRFSLAMNRLGFYIPNNSLSRQGALENGQPRYYYLQAKTAGDFMSKTFGNPTHILEGTDANNPDKVAKFLEGKTGIYVIVNNNSTTAGYTGHVDLIQNGHIPGGANATNVPGGIKSIRIWEFKP
ncbi:T6SS effector amidase Tae4 family protein [uncultured Chryseobacterium sp.]|uniref:T6SS effector amidase Tae4 family protein n=1 Tax=uncultured Chryseobacterium sp. TaxID=259322 RepID=UPI00258622B8|nr:T6SS effector amidase Tae4 family protein [uncultured Chryseobacterium sp.]